MKTILNINVSELRRSFSPTLPHIHSQQYQTGMLTYELAVKNGPRAQGYVNGKSINFRVLIGGNLVSLQ